MKIKDKKILVVGAAGLLGSHLVKRLLLEGAEVIAADVNTSLIKQRLFSLDVNDDNSSLTLIKVNLTCKAEVTDMFKHIDKLTGAVNCCYPRNNNYGNHFFDVDVDDFNENVSMNLGSSFLFMQGCAAYFKSRKSDFSLVNISSIYGVMAPKFEIYNNTEMTVPVEYAAIKAGLIHLSRYVTKYIGNSKFRINLVSPGGISDQQPDSFLEAYKKETFGRGMLDVADILGAIIFLLSSSSKFVNGQNIIVDDGFSI